MAVKLAGSIDPRLSASRQRSEFVANATSAASVRTAVRIPDWEAAP
jgi:hypothetical protein